MVSSQVFDNTGNVYDIFRVIRTNVSFDLQAYHDYSPVFLPVSFAMSYGLSFASAVALITHTFLYHSKYIFAQARYKTSEQPDIHAQLMSIYTEVPNWWYLSILCLCLNF